MNALLSAFERASLFGLAALILALIAQWILDERVPAAWRVWIWRVALLQTAFALLPPATLRLAVLPARPLVAPLMRPTVAPPVPIPRELVSAIPSIATPRQSAPLRVPVVSSSAARPNRMWAVAAVYALGLGIYLGYLALCLARLRRLLRACNAVEEAKTEESMREIARKMQVAPPRLLESRLGAPCLVGIWRPAIVLPSALLTPQNPDLAAVLAHELAHLKRRDLLWNALFWPIQALFWFHPLTWFAPWFLALETESACDEMTLSSTRVAPKSYGALILSTMNNPSTPLAAGMTDGFLALKKRLSRLNHAPKRPRRGFGIAFAGALCIALGASVPLRLVARAQTQPKSAVAAKAKTQPPIVRTLQGHRIPMNDTPEVEVGLPATLEEAFKRANTTISGRVVFENGRPAAGVRVMAFSVWNTQTELWGYRRDKSNNYRWPTKINKLLSGMTTTRADGTYRFTGLLPQRYSIHIWSYKLGNSAPAGWLPPYRGVGVTTVAQETRQARDTVLRRSAQIRIRAVDQDTGAPLEGVTFLGFIVNESGEKITSETVDAHQGSRPSKGNLDEQTTDKNGYCTLDLEGGKAYFFLWGGLYGGSPAGEAAAMRKSFDERFITSEGLYKKAAWCEVTTLAPNSQRESAPRKSWKGETEFQLKKGPATTFTVRLKRYKALTPEYKSLLKMLKRQFFPKTL